MGEDTENIFRLYILTNFDEMVKRKNIQEIIEFINNPGRMAMFLNQLNASKEILEVPAHREQIEECLISIMKSIINSIREGETGIKLEYLENGLKMSIDSPKKAEETILQFYENSYNFIKKGNTGEELKKVQGNLNENKITTHSKEILKSSDDITNISSIIILDKEGFVVESIQQTAGENEIHIKRTGLNVITESDNSIKWNGNPFKLNKEEATNEDFCNQMVKTINKYPKTKEYYENLVGKDLVKKSLENALEK